MTNKNLKYDFTINNLRKQLNERLNDFDIKLQCLKCCKRVYKKDGSDFKSLKMNFSDNVKIYPMYSGSSDMELYIYNMSNNKYYSEYIGKEKDPNKIMDIVNNRINQYEQHIIAIKELLKEDFSKIEVINNLLKAIDSFKEIETIHNDNIHAINSNSELYYLILGYLF